MRQCTSCGRDVQDGFAFCGACGAPVPIGAMGQPAQRDERKVVTVLFADLVGFTTRAEEMDPEDVGSMLRGYHTHVAGELRRFGATVEKFIGDAVMAVFGAPIAHEDDPERAVRAALAICRWAAEHGDGLQIRIGINTGEALVSLDAEPERGEGMLAGDVVNAAARLQTAADPNSALVGDETYQQTARLVEYERIGPVKAKGMARQLLAWRPIRPRSRIGDDLGQDVRTPLVGRATEVALLHSLLDRAKNGRSPQLVTLVGVPGIGKSRLIRELFDHVAQEPDLTTWRQGRSLAYGDGVAYWAFSEMVKAQAGILENDDAGAALAKLRASIHALLADEGDARWVALHTAPLIGVSGESIANERLADAFAAWRRLVEAMASARPTVLVFEDVHLADDGLLDFIEELPAMLADVPLLVLATARPELLARRTTWAGGMANATTVGIEALGAADTARIVAALLPEDHLTTEMRSTLIEHAGGNPLFAEQFARMVFEGGVTGGRRLPQSVQAIIAARLDLLSPNQKALLQDAAVIGKVFWLGALSRVASAESAALTEDLRSLERRQMIRRERESIVAGEVQYVFHHGLLRDTAYGQLPRKSKAERHRRAAAWLESLAPDRSEDRAEMLAHHYLEAINAARAAGDEIDFAEQAATAMREAGARTSLLGAWEAASRFYAGALKLTSSSDPTHPELLFRHALATAWSTGHGYEEMGEAVDALEAAGMLELAAEAASWTAKGYQMRGERDIAYRYANRALALSESSPRSMARLEAVTRKAGFQMQQGEHDDAIRVAEVGLDLAESLGADALRARLLNIIGLSRLLRGELDGLEQLEASVAVALHSRSAEQIASAMQNHQSMLGHLGRLEDQARVLAECRAHVDRYGVPHDMQWIAAEEVYAAYVRGRWDDALERAEVFLDAGQHYQEPAVRATRVGILLARGQVDAAAADSETALSLARRAKDTQVLMPALWCQAAVELAREREREAKQLVVEVLEHGDAIIKHTWEFIFEFADLTSRLGLDAELERVIVSGSPGFWHPAMLHFARGEYPSAADILASAGNRVGEARARLRAAEDRAARGIVSSASSQLAAAIEFYRSVEAIAELERAELAARQVR